MKRSNTNFNQITPNDVIKIVEATCVNVTTEGAAQRDIVDTLKKAGFSPESEKRISEKDRIDIYLNSTDEEIGIEVKIKGLRRSIYRQLERYAACSGLSQLILVTSIPWPSGMTDIGGKPFFVASLNKGWL